MSDRAFYVRVRKPDPPLRPCRDPKCKNLGDGMQGFCKECSRRRQIEDRWETIPLDEMEQHG